MTMPQTTDTIKKLVELMAFEEAEVKYDEETKKLSVFINDRVTPILKKNLGLVVRDFNTVAQLIAKKNNEDHVFVDVNNYRVERERIITELAKAAAKKVAATKEVIELPPMNAYERRLIHTALAIHPEVKTESTGEGKGRRVKIYLL